MACGNRNSKKTIVFFQSLAILSSSRPLLQPILTSVTLTSLSSLSGLVTFAAVLVGDLGLGATFNEQNAESDAEVNFAGSRTERYGI